MYSFFITITAVVAMLYIVALIAASGEPIHRESNTDIEFMEIARGAVATGGMIASMIVLGILAYIGV